MDSNGGKSYASPMSEAFVEFLDQAVTPVSGKINGRRTEFRTLPTEGRQMYQITRRNSLHR